MHEEKSIDSKEETTSLSCNRNGNEKEYIYGKGIFDYEIKILTAPGKRKDVDRQLLAEDISGFKYYKSYAIFWLVDGAPGPEVNQPKEPDYFGSRIVARDIGESFEDASIMLISKEETIGNNECGIRIIEEMRRLLEEKLNTRIKEFNEYLEKLSLPEDKKNNTYVLNWAASFIAAIVSLKSQSGILLTAGDCSGLVKINKEFLINWNVISSNDNVKNFKELITFLKNKYNFDCSDETITAKKINKTIKLDFENKSLSLSLNDNNTGITASIDIGNNKFMDEFNALLENGNLNIYTIEIKEIDRENNSGKFHIKWSAPKNNIPKSNITVTITGDNHASFFKNISEIKLISDGVDNKKNIMKLEKENIKLDYHEKNTDDDKTLISFKIIEK